MPPIRTLLPVLALLALTALAPPARALQLPADTTALLSGAPDLLTPLPAPVADARTDPQALDVLGRHVAFSSESDGLLDGDDDSVRNVYVKDVASGTVTLVSRADGPDGEPAHADCDEAAIGEAGTHVAFTCDGPLDPADTNDAPDVYLRDLVNGRTTLVSRVSGLGAVGDGASDRPAIDATGRYVAFVSRAGNIAGLPAGVGGGDRAYRRQLGGGDVVTPVSVPDGVVLPATRVANDVNSLALSATGDVIAFDTEQALDPAGRDGNGLRDVYARRVASATTFLVSRASSGTGAVGDGPSATPRVDADGDVFLFDSTAKNLVARGDPFGDSDVYRRTMNTLVTSLVSVTVGGIENNDDAYAVGLSGDGATAAYLTAAAGVDPADSGTGGADIYVQRPGGTILASRADGETGTPANNARAGAISEDGTKVVTTRGGVRGTTPALVELRDLTASRTRLVSRPPGEAPFANAGGDAFDGAVSADGRFVAFFATAPALGVDPAGDGALLVRDTDSGAVTLVSRADGPDGAPLPGTPHDAAITPDGRFVVFTLDPGGRFALAPAFPTVWLRDLREGRTVLVSRADGADGAPANGNAYWPSVSDDGSRVAFMTDASNLGDGDATPDADVHVRDLAAGRTLLASRPSGDGPIGPGDGDARYGAISGDGRSVGFSSTATNLGDGDADALEDVFVRRLDTGVTRLVGRADNGAKADSGARFRAIDRDGDRIALSSAATNFPAREQEQLYVRDLAASRLLLVSRGDGPDGAPLADGRVEDARLSADGSRVAFEASSPRPLAPGAPTEEGLQVFLRDLAAGTTRLLSRASGADGAPSRFAQLSGIAPDGGCVAFSAYPRTLGAAPSDDYAQAFLRVVDDRCGAALPDDGGNDDGGGGGDTPGGDDRGGAGAGRRRAATRDRTAPRLTAVRLSRTRLRSGGRPTALAARAPARGAARPATSTVLSFRSSERGRLTVAVARELPGRRAAGGRCVQAGEAVRRARRCTAVLTVATIRRTLRRAGAGTLTLTAKLGRRALVRGRYRLTLVVRDAAGNVSRAATVRLAVVR